MSKSFAAMLLSTFPACTRTEAAPAPAPAPVALAAPAAPLAVPTATPGEIQPPSELDQFLRGMLITSTVQSTREGAWPIPDQTEAVGLDLIDRWMPRLKQDWGFKNRDDLRQLASTPADQWTENHRQLFTQLTDAPALQLYWKRLAEADPSDLQANANYAAYLADDPAAELKVLDALKEPSHYRPGRGVSPAEHHSTRCVVLIQLRRYDEAQAACNQAAALDAGHGARTLAKILMLQGKKKEALVQAEQVFHATDRKRSDGAYLTLGAAQAQNGRAAEALATWKEGLSV